MVESKLSSARTPMVGRAQPLSRLRALHQAVRASRRPQTVAVIGPAGIGKTRLVREFLLHEPGARVVRSSAREGDSAFAVFARLLRGRFGLIEGAAVEISREKLRAGLVELFGDRKVGDVCYLLGGWLGIEYQDTPLLRALSKDPEQLAMSRRAVLEELIVRDAQPEHKPDAPLVLVFDDMHNAHADAHALLIELAASIAAPVLIVIAGRPELLSRHEGWTDSEKLARTVIELGPLGDEDADEVMRQLLGPVGDADPELLGELVEVGASLALGNPALLEQMVHVFHDIGVLTSDDPFAEHEVWTVHPEKMGDARLPMTVEDAVAARISALAPKERELLERAAVMGGVFWLGGLLAIERAAASGGAQLARVPLFWERGTEADRQGARELLNELTERDYVLRLPEASFAGEDEYVFKHNLERETLAKAVPLATARRWHHAIAEWLSMRDGGDDNDEHLAILARHYREAQRGVRAASTFFRAGKAARAEFANARAVELYQEGFTLLREHDQIPAEARLLALHDYGDALHAIGDNERAEELYREMLARAYGLDLPAKGGAAHGKLGRLARDLGRLREAEEHLKAALELFSQVRDERGIASTTDDLGKVAFLRGDYLHALALTERGLVLRRALGDVRSIALSLSNLGMIYHARGELLRATESFEQALSLLREEEERAGIAFTLSLLGRVAEAQGDDARAQDVYQEALALAREAGDKVRQAEIGRRLGESLVRSGDGTRALSILSRSERQAEELGDRLLSGEVSRLKSGILRARGEAEAARTELLAALASFRKAGHRLESAACARALAETAAEPALARQHYREAIAALEGSGHDAELSQLLQAYESFMTTTEPLASDPSHEDERRALRARLQPE